MQVKKEVKTKETDGGKVSSLLDCYVKRRNVMSDINNNVPIKMSISIASANEALEYWFSKKVFRDEVKISKVTFNQNDYFSIEFNRETETKPE